MWRDQAWRGRAGQAFRLGEPARWTGPPPVRSPRATLGRDRLARSPRRSSSQGTACGSWTRAWGQREPAHDRTGRLKKSPARWPGSLKGGLDIPSTHARCNSLRGEHPLRTLARQVWSRTGRIGIRLGFFVSHPIAVSFNNNRLPVMHQSIDQGRGQGVVRVTQGAPFPERSIRG